MSELGEANGTTYCEEIMAELQTYRGRRRPSIREVREIVTAWLGQYAYNTMELCRIINGLMPTDFHDCNWTCEEKPFFNAKGQCKCKERSCRITNRMLHGYLTQMQKEGLINSIKIQWLDGRETGAVNHFPTDFFRIWYTDRSLLSTRLIQDVVSRIGKPNYL